MSSSRLQVVLNHRWLILTVFTQRIHSPRKKRKDRSLVQEDPFEFNALTLVEAERMYAKWTKLLGPRSNRLTTLLRNAGTAKEVTVDTVNKAHSEITAMEPNFFLTGPSERPTLNEEEATYALRTMNYMRRMENKAAELYRLRLINGFLHLYAGQEAVAVGTKMSMKDVDSLITAYRCHGFAVVFGVSAREVLAELMGRKTGISKGKGGSMHMYAKQFYGGDGIVGGQVPIGAGLSFAHKYNGSGAVSFALYGDGAASQGQIFEAWNMSKLWNLPAVYICENNKYGMGTVVHRHSANTNFYTRGDLIPGIKVDGMKVVDVKEAIRFARDYALRNGPIILEMQTYRYFGHSMSDPGVGYRTREEIKSMQQEQDPIVMFGKLLVEKNLKTEQEVQEIRETAYKQVDKELEQAKADPWPEMSEIGTDVYAKPMEKTRGKVPWQTH